MDTFQTKIVVTNKFQETNKSLSNNIRFTVFVP